jgi:hypothetical protein
MVSPPQTQIDLDERPMRKGAAKTVRTHQSTERAIKEKRGVDIYGR